MPALEIMAMIYLLLPLHFQRMPPGFSVAFRLIHFVKPWAMIEVFMLGLLVTISKLSALASVVPNIALGAFVLLMFSVTAAAANFDRRGYWKRVADIRQLQEQVC
jgi:paraquat-inducible protein A